MYPLALVRTIADSISVLTRLVSISSYSRMYSGIVLLRKFASQANSKHFLIGQKKSALTSFKFSNAATMYAGLARACTEKFKLGFVK